MKIFAILLSLLFTECIGLFAETDCNTVESCKKIISEQKARIETLEQKAAEKKPSVRTSPEWKLIGTSGISKFVCVSPQGLKDKQFLAQILNKVAKDTRIVEVNFFDDCRSTPSSFPMTDSQMLHLKARYNFNDNSGTDRFVFINNGKETPAKIRPGYAQ